MIVEEAVIEVGVLKFSVLANHVVDHVIVGILLVVYSGVDHINTTCLSPQSVRLT